jgi:hydroxymethylpyrimidine pyrophosphatase-like HAD family hydrolase
MRYVILAKTRISFDYDGTLSTSKGKETAIDRIKNGNDVYIITARQKSDSESVYNTANELGIDKHHVIFTNGEDKWKYILQYDIDIHYDNNEEQIKKIHDKTNARAILWK